SGPGPWPARTPPSPPHRRSRCRVRPPAGRRPRVVPPHGRPRGTLESCCARTWPVSVVVVTKVPTWRRHSGGTLEDVEEIASIDAYWRAANYLSVGQIYLLDNPLLREPLRPEHIKPRLLGHWGTVPGINFCFAHLNRIIRR